MKTIQRIYLVLFFTALFGSSACATWSIIVIDTKTGEIGIAGASCTYSVYGIGAIAPGKGAIVVQAMSNPLARAKGFKMMMAGAAPEEIMNAIKDPAFNPEEQQYAILCLAYPKKPLTYTGEETTTDKGAFVSDGLSVQGNTLAGPTVLKAVFEAAKNAQMKGLPIEEVLMLALEAGAVNGGDKRCSDTRASSAFLTVAKRDDARQSPYLNLVVNGDDEKVNAVEVLRRKFDAQKTEATN